MRNLFKSFLEQESVQNARKWLSEKWAPVHIQWMAVTAPVRKALAPATEKFREWTAPVRQRWHALKEKYPKSAFAFIWLFRLGCIGFVFLLGLIISVGFGAFGPLPDMDELRNIESANSTEIYSVDSVMIGKFFIENRTTIPLDSISKHVTNALIATEDRRFFEHSGIDYTSWARVGLGMLSRKKSSGGGSTLSQQLAKNLYPRRRYKIPGLSLIINKIRENYTSVKLERIYSKKELLNLYLNTVPFGGEKYGISVASKHYFGKKAKDLSADEAAVLIGMLKATTFYNPVRNPKNAERRRNVVLRQMQRNGHIDEEEYQALSKKPVKAKYHTHDGNNDGVANYFREYLRTEVMPKILKENLKDDGTKYNLYTDGLRIYTTLHSKMQQYAEEAVAEHMTSLQERFDKHWDGYKQGRPWGDDKWIDEQIRRSDRWDYLKSNGLSDSLAIQNFETPVKMNLFVMKDGGIEIDTVMSPIDSVRHYFCLLNCGFMAMDHHNGYVRAWVGGTNFKHFKFDHIKSRRQVGSTFKPIVYAAALQKGLRPCDYIPNELVEVGDWEPHNADEIYGGFYSIMGALTGSVNVVAAQLIEQAGIDRTISLARAMGVTSSMPREYGISLGATEVALYDMMKVYGTIANEGERPDPVLVLNVSTRKGDLVYDYKSKEKPKPVRALTKEEARMMTVMMQNVVDRGTGSRLRRAYGLYSGDFAGKTGTTQNQADGWFICFNPQLVTGAWVGAESPAVRFRSMSLGQGSSMALPIVGTFWHKLAGDKQFRRMPMMKFKEMGEEEMETYDCPPFVPLHPDSLDIMLQDSFLRDSILAGNTEDLERRMYEYFGIDPNEESDPEDPERRRPIEKTKAFFEKLLGRLKEDQKEKDQQPQTPQQTPPPTNPAPQPKRETPAREGGEG
ncbi:MAG: transglycosylase domain-containing protein [Saprospiraceae bacterium]